MFVTLEGIDRSGKTTQAKMLAEALGPDTLLIREPGGTEMAERVRALIKDPSLEMGDVAELLMFCAARADLVERVIEPARTEGRDIVCDRYVDSTAAYQGAARGIGVDAVERLAEMVVGECIPDVTVLVKVDADTAHARGLKRRNAGEPDGSDRFESEGLEFQRAVAAAYDELAARHQERFVVVDGEGEPAEVHKRVLAAVDDRVPGRLGA